LVAGQICVFDFAKESEKGSLQISLSLFSTQHLHIMSKEIEVSVIEGRGLPAADANGLFFKSLCFLSIVYNFILFFLKFLNFFKCLSLGKSDPYVKVQLGTLPIFLFLSTQILKLLFSLALFFGNLFY
jgi:hypothetical protein